MWSMSEDASLNTFGNKCKLLATLFCLPALTSCPCNCAVRINPFPYGDSGVDIYSDKEGKDRIGQMHASLDDNGICLSYDLTKDFVFTFDASSLFFNRFDIVFFDYPDYSYSFQDVKAFDSDGNLTILKDEKDNQFSPYLGICSSSECFTSLEVSLSFTEGHNELHIPLKNDKWSILKNYLKVAFVPIVPEEKGACYTSKQIFLEPNIAKDIEFYKDGIMFQ